MGRKVQRKFERDSAKTLNYKTNGVSESSFKSKKSDMESFGCKDISLSSSQLHFQDVIRNNIITFAEGPAGTGKTLAALHYATEQYLKDPTLKIIVIRTPVEAGSDKVGFLPSDLKEKLQPHFASTKLLLETLLSPDKVQADMEGRFKRIDFLIPNYAIGSTWDNAIVILDEGQQLQPLIMKLLLERIGINSKMIVLGDRTQLYATTEQRHGMLDAMKRFFYYEQDGTIQEPKFEDIGYFKFEPEDCMRSDIVKTVLKAYSTS